MHPSLLLPPKVTLNDRIPSHKVSDNIKMRMTTIPAVQCGGHSTKWMAADCETTALCLQAVPSSSWADQPYSDQWIRGDHIIYRIRWRTCQNPNNLQMEGHKLFQSPRLVSFRAHLTFREEVTHLRSRPTPFFCTRTKHLSRKIRVRNEMTRYR